MPSHEDYDRVQSRKHLLPLHTFVNSSECSLTSRRSLHCPAPTFGPGHNTAPRPPIDSISRKTRRAWYELKPRGEQVPKPPCKHRQPRRIADHARRFQPVLISAGFPPGESPWLHPHSFHPRRLARETLPFPRCRQHATRLRMTWPPIEFVRSARALVPKEHETNPARAYAACLPAILCRRHY